MRITRFRFVFTFSVVFSVALCTLAPAQQPATPPPDFYFYNGDTRVDVVVARDELAILGSPGVPIAASSINAAAPGVQLTPTASGPAYLKYPTQSSSLDALAARADQISPVAGEIGAVIYPAGSPPRGDTRGALTRRIALKLNGQVAFRDVAAVYGVGLVQQVEYSADTYIVEAISGDLFAAIRAANAMFEDGVAEFATPLIFQQQIPRFIPNDPQFPNQWHLRNTGQVPGIAGEDVNIVTAWDSYTGAGVNIAISDTGVEVNHPDLSPNARTDIDIDINGGDGDPTPTSDPHGTSCAGIAAARGNNGTGVTGAAFESGIVGIRVIEGPSDDQDEADAMNHQVSAVSPVNYVHINSNSWGPSDCGCILGGMGPLTAAALANGTTNGRGGRGTIYVWAGGNGRQFNDNVNYDAYASSRYTIAVGATGANGQFSYYSEPGASLLVNTSSQDSSSGTTTTTFPSGYTNNFGGTSSAAPLAAGVVGLMLEANPSLGWRDVQHILVESAEMNHPAHVDWLANGSGRMFNHNYGFGRVDAAAAVSLAEGWLNVPSNTAPVNILQSVSASIPDNNATGVTSGIAVSGAPGDFFIEHVEVVLNVSHARRGQLSVVLTAPSGFQSVLAAVHSDTGANYSNWQFTSVGHWGENPNGTWQLTVRDLQSGTTGTFNNWRLRIHGLRTSQWVAPPVDTDQDLLPDDDEINIYGTDPNNPDTDGDGVLDGTEVDLGTDPLDPDDFPLLSADNPYGMTLLFGCFLLISVVYVSRSNPGRNRRQ